MKQVDKPVQFGLVPFAASVNVGAGQATASLDGHDGHLADPPRELRLVDDELGEQPAQICPEGRRRLVHAWRRLGHAENQPLTRFSLYDDMLAQSGREEIRTRASRMRATRNEERQLPEMTTGRIDYT